MISASNYERPFASLRLRGAMAAVVAQTVVEPHMSTIFGVLSLMHYDAKSGKTSGRCVAVPGFWAAYDAGRGRFGSKSSGELIPPAVHLARENDGSFVHRAHDHELDALRNFITVRERPTALLIDTYDTERAAQRVAQLSRELQT